jgi:hypothetical protein
MSHIQDTIEEAKLTAQQEAKKSLSILFKSWYRRSGCAYLFSTLNLTMLKVELWS